jgi:hypothetical protein
MPPESTIAVRAEDCRVSLALSEKKPVRWDAITLDRRPAVAQYAPASLDSGADSIYYEWNDRELSGTS